MYTAKDFVNLYNSLEMTKLSFQANKKLIEIQESPSSWRLAVQMIQLGNQVERQHGCLLLSKKIDKYYSRSMEAQLNLTQFILGLSQLNKTLKYCLAKLGLYLGWDYFELGKHNNQRTVVGVLSQLPLAANRINILPQQNNSCNERELVINLFNKYKPYLVEAFQSCPDQIIECLQNYLINDYEIKSKQLVFCLLSKPLTKVSKCLQLILLNEKYEQLRSEIYNYLIQNSTGTQYFVNLIAFTRSLNLMSLPGNILTDLFSRILFKLKLENCDNENSVQKDFIVESFDLWTQLSTQLVKISHQQNSQNNNEQVIICANAFLQLWKIIVECSLQKQMPKFHQQNKQSLQIVDLERDPDDIQDLRLPTTSIYHDDFRENALDFIQVIFTTLSKFPDYKNASLELILSLTKSNNPLYLELAVFVTSSIVDNLSDNIVNEIAEIIKSIISNQNAKIPYIWQQLIKLFGKVGTEAVCNGVIFQSALIVLKQSILAPQLCLVACQNFHEIIMTCKQSSQKAKQGVILQNYFQFIYQNIYFQTGNKKVFSLLTKSFIVYIYCFKSDLNYFIQFLKAVNKKIEETSEFADKMEIVQSVSFAHFFVELQYSSQFTNILSEFFKSFLPVFIHHIQFYKTKKLQRLFQGFSTIITISGGYSTQTWIQAINHLKTYQNVSQHKYYIINLYNKILNVQEKNQNYQISITHMLANVQKSVSEILLTSQKESYNLITACLNFHHTLISKYAETLSQYKYMYDPEPILSFIMGKVFTGQVKYEYQISKLSLAIIRVLISKQYRVQQLLQQTLKIYPTIFESLWKSIQSIIYESFKQGGTELFRVTFENVFPTMAPPNPLFQKFIEGIKDSKLLNFKKILAALK